MPSRLLAIERCCDEMEAARASQTEFRVLIAVVGELDWLHELHNLIWNSEASRG